MSKHKSSIIPKTLVIIILSTLLISCHKDKSKLIGTWEDIYDYKETMTFHENGEITFENNSFPIDSSFSFKFEILTENNEYVEYKMTSYVDGKLNKSVLHRATFQNENRILVESLDNPGLLKDTYVRREVSEEEREKQVFQEYIRKDSIRLSRLDSKADSLQFADEVYHLRGKKDMAAKIYHGLISASEPLDADGCQWYKASAYLELSIIESENQNPDTQLVFIYIDSAQIHCPESGTPYLNRAYALNYFNLNGVEENLNIAYEKFDDGHYQLESIRYFIDQNKDKLDLTKINFDWQSIECNIP